MKLVATQLAALVVDEVLEQRAADPLGHAAVDLALDDQSG